MEITQLDYYATLELTPAASRRQIENAYQFALQNYAPDSLAAYGLLSEEEREEVVRYLGEARRVLCDAAARRDYDRKLIADGTYPADAFAAPAAEPAAEKPAAPIAAPPAPEEKPAAEAPRERAWWPFEREKPAGAKAPPPPAAPTPAPDASTPAALDGRPIGPDELRQIREYRGLRLDEVSEKSKISLSNLRYLEEGKFAFLPAPVYVKGFLRTYARILRIDAEKLINDYMPRYEAQRPS